MAIKTTIQLRRDTLTNWSSKNPVLAKGEIALVDTNNVFGVEGASVSPLWVIRIGDGVSQFNQLPETAYALKSYVDGELSGIHKDIEDLTTGDLSSIKSEISVISIDLDTLEENFVKFGTEFSELSSKVDNKVKLNDGAIETLNIKQVDADWYHENVIGGKVDNSTLYIVSSDYINAYGQKIENVGDATSSTDAVNLKQVTEISSSLFEKIETLEGDVETAISEQLEPLAGQVGRLETALSGEGGITSRVDTLEGNLTTLTSETIPNLREELEGQISDVSDEVASLDTSLSNYLVTISDPEESGVDKYKYVVKQGGVDIGAIEIPHDVFVDKGEISVIGGETYLLLTLNNDEQTVLSVNATSLVDVYTGLSSDTIDVTVDEFKVMASVKDGSITTEKLADGAVTPEKLSQTETFIFDCGGADLSETESAS